MIVCIFYLTLGCNVKFPNNYLNRLDYNTYEIGQIPLTTFYLLPNFNTTKKCCGCIDKNWFLTRNRLSLIWWHNEKHHEEWVHRQREQWTVEDPFATIGKMGHSSFPLLMLHQIWFIWRRKIAFCILKYVNSSGELGNCNCIILLSIVM